MKWLARCYSFALALQVDFGLEQPESLRSVLKEPVSNPVLVQTASRNSVQSVRVYFSLLRWRFAPSPHALDTPTARRGQLRVVTFP